MRQCSEWSCQARAWLGPPAGLLPGLWPLLAFLVVVSALALARYRQTLD